MLTTIICTYNVGSNSRQDGQSFIKCCLDSFCATTRNVPLIIVDEGSTEDTYEIVETYRSRLPDMVAIKFPVNGGLRNAFTEAVKHVKTSHFVRIDADILFSVLEWDKLVMDHFYAHPECGAVGATQRLPGGRLWCAGDLLLPHYQHISVPIKGQYRICHSVMGCFSAYPIAVWKEVDGLSCEQWMRAETEDLNLRIGQAGYEVHCLPFEFMHCHNMARKKDGEYNNKLHVVNRITNHMKQRFGIGFYTDSPATALPFLRSASYLDVP
jgi:glycosyltransferase involved in cell wall biosynthesis